MTDGCMQEQPAPPSPRSPRIRASPAAPSTASPRPHPPTATPPRPSPPAALLASSPAPCRATSPCRLGRGARQPQPPRAAPPRAAHTCAAHTHAAPMHVAPTRAAPQRAAPAHAPAPSRRRRPLRRRSRHLTAHLLGCPEGSGRRAAKQRSLRTLPPQGRMRAGARTPVHRCAIAMEVLPPAQPQRAAPDLPRPDVQPSQSQISSRGRGRCRSGTTRERRRTRRGIPRPLRAAARGRRPPSTPPRCRVRSPTRPRTPAAAEGRR